MCSYKVFLVLTVLVVASYAKLITIKNAHSVAIIATVDGTDYTIATDTTVPIDLADNWSGTITAVPAGAEVLDGPRTKLELSLNTAGDSYYVSLIDGFNLPAKIVPQGDTNCPTSVCRANILKVCPLTSEVTNSTNIVVACQNSPLVMGTLCPLAVVDTLTSNTNVQSCTTATSYLIVFT